MSNDVFKRIKSLEYDVMLGDVLRQEDVEFLYSCLTTLYSDDVFIAALLFITESDLDVLLPCLKRFDMFQKKAQLIAIPFLACTDYLDCYEFLLDRLGKGVSEEEALLICSSLASTHYPVLPLVLLRLITDNQIYLGYLKHTLVLMGLKEVGGFISRLPEIPHEAIFRELFGHDAIDQIKQNK